jgi:hypothetical protein
MTFLVGDLSTTDFKSLMCLYAGLQLVPFSICVSTAKKYAPLFLPSKETQELYTGVYLI